MVFNKEEVLSEIVSKIGVKLLKDSKRDLLFVVENSSLDKVEQFHIRKKVVNYLHNLYKIIKSDVSEYVNDKDEFLNKLYYLESKNKRR